MYHQHRHSLGEKMAAASRLRWGRKKPKRYRVRDGGQLLGGIERGGGKERESVHVVRALRGREVFIIAT